MGHPCTVEQTPPLLKINPFLALQTSKIRPNYYLLPTWWTKHPPTKSKPLPGPHKPHKTPQITIYHLHIGPDTP